MTEVYVHKYNYKSTYYLVLFRTLQIVKSEIYHILLLTYSSDKSDIFCHRMHVTQLFFEGGLSEGGFKREDLKFWISTRSSVRHRWRTVSKSLKKIEFTFIKSKRRSFKFILLSYTIESTACISLCTFTSISILKLI